MDLSSSSGERNIEMHERLVTEVWNGRDPDAAVNFVAQNFVGHQPAYPEIQGAEAYVEYVRETLTAFPDFHVDQHKVLSDGEVVVTHYTISGTHNGPLGPLPPTGRFVELEGMSVARYVDGRIVEVREFVDTAELRHQLGLGFPTILVTVPRLLLRAIRS